MLALLKKLTPDVRSMYGWVGTEISLRNRDHGVREIQRPFQKLSWDFQNVQAVKASHPPDFDLFLGMVKDLMRYFDLHPTTKGGNNGSGSGGSEAPSVWGDGPALPAAAASKEQEHQHQGGGGGDGGGGGRRPAKKEVKCWVKGSKKSRFRAEQRRNKNKKWCTVASNVGGAVHLMLKELKAGLGRGGAHTTPRTIVWKLRFVPGDAQYIHCCTGFCRSSAAVDCCPCAYTGLLALVFHGKERHIVSLPVSGTTLALME